MNEMNIQEASATGNFDWIVEVEDLIPLLSKDNLGLKSDQILHCLVVGCGTSTLSSILQKQLCYDDVLSVDIQETCISSMKLQYCNEPNLKWIVYDMNRIHSSNERFSLPEDAFNIIIDKGTFDAILVEGTSVYLLAEVKRLLQIWGIYFLVSFHSQSFLEPILTSSSLGFDVEFFFPKGHSYDKTENRNCTVAICRNRTKSVFDFEEVSRVEREVLTHRYVQECPLLTPREEEMVRAIFHNDTHNLYLGYREIYEQSFLSVPSLGYSLDLFLEDLQTFPVANEGTMNCVEFLQFIAEKQ